MTKFKADPFDELAIKRSSFSVIVGALVPYIKFMKKNSLDFCILELDKSALKVDDLKCFYRKKRLWTRSGRPTISA